VDDKECAVRQCCTAGNTRGRKGKCTPRTCPTRKGVTSVFRVKVQEKLLLLSHKSRMSMIILKNRTDYHPFGILWVASFEGQHFLLRSLHCLRI
jgi:hypothetical protein